MPEDRPPPVPIPLRPEPFPPALAAPHPPPAVAATGEQAIDSPTGDAPRVRGRPFAKGNPGGGRRKKSAAWKAEMKRGCEWAPRVLYTLMMNSRTPSETRRKAAEFFIVWQYGKPVAALSNPDGSPLFPPAPSAESPLMALIARLTARRAGVGSPEGPHGATAPENAPPGANGEAPEGSAA